MAIRKGLVFSAVGHGGLLVGILLAMASPRQFGVSREEPIMVDVVTPQEIPRSSARPEQKDAARPEKKETDPSEQKQAAPPQPSQANAAPATPAPKPSPGSSSAELPGIDLANIAPMLGYRLPGSFDAPADKQAMLSREEVAAFKMHLRKCWQLPEGVAPTSSARVVVRAYLARDGALMAEPTLVEATASAEGPGVMQAAMRALTQCQPFGFLPADRYAEWKVLDLSFSPREMSGG